MPQIKKIIFNYWAQGINYNYWLGVSIVIINSNTKIKVKKVLTFLAFISFSQSFSNQDEQNDILNTMVYHNYDLDDGKYDKLDSYFSFPFAYNGKDDSHIVKNQRDLKKFFKKIKKTYPRDHSHLDWKSMDVKLLNERIAIVNAMFSRIKNNGTTYFTGVAMYSFRKVNDSWKIFAITPFKPYNYFEFE